MNKSAKKAIIAISIILGCVIVALSILSIVFISTSNNYKIQLDNVYKRDFYELVSNVNSLEVDLSKLIATNSTTSQQELLMNIYNTCTFANSNLSGLPISNNKIANVNKYVNTLGGYSFSLLTKSIASNKLTNEDFLQIENLYESCKVSQYDLNNYLSELSHDHSIVEQVKYSNGDNSKFDGGLTNINSSSEVPSLIYDGPFSDSVVNKEVKGIKGNIISKEVAQDLISTQFSYFDNVNVNYTGETNGKFATYNFDVVSNDLQLFVQITKEGGFLLSVNATKYGDGDNTLTISQCKNLAHNFASLLGFDNMYTVWSQQNGDITYINLAPIINNVIYYPDLIKVKIHTKLAQVVGWEATNYAYNHIERSAIVPAISFEEAQELLSPNLTVVERNLCYIPNKYVGESQAYEFVCEWKDYTYYVYLDVVSGEELNILRVIKTSSGDLLL